MKAADVMTRSVITARPESTVAEAARLMLQHRISGLPVVDDRGRVIGIITEGDLLRRTETGTWFRYPPWWWPHIGSGRLAQDYVAANARRVGEIMTRKVASLESKSALADLVRLMTTLQVKRLPIVDNDRLVGIVSRADLLRPLAVNARGKRHLHERTPTDADIRTRILAELATQEWAPPAGIGVSVIEGVVELSGTIDDDRQRAALTVLTENVDGVTAVLDRLISARQQPEECRAEETGTQLLERLMDADEAGSKL